MKRVAFLVYDKSLTNIETSDFYKWLKDKGFITDVNNPKHGYPYWECPWMHIDLSNKTFSFGMPGVELFEPIGSHAITVEDFKVIFEIYEKYRNKSLFEF